VYFTKNDFFKVGVFIKKEKDLFSSFFLLNQPLNNGSKISATTKKIRHVFVYTSSSIFSYELDTRPTEFPGMSTLSKYLDIVVNPDLAIAKDRLYQDYIQKYQILLIERPDLAKKLAIDLIKETSLILYPFRYKRNRD
jgi:hypothetical protein